MAALADAVRVDPSELRPATAAKATAGLIIPLIAGIALGQPAIGATASFGALSVGIPLITAGPRTPARTMLATSVCMGGATFIGSVSGLVPIAHLLVLAAAGFAAGLLVAAGRGATQVGVNAMVALLVFGRFTADPGTAALHASWVLAGGLFQTGLAVLIRSPHPLRAQRTALAAAYESLASAATADQIPIEVAEAAAVARDTVRPWLNAEDRPETEPLRSLADELDRIRLELHALKFQRAELAPGGRDRQIVDESLSLLSDALGEIAAALSQRREAAGVHPAAAKLLADADQLPDDQPITRFCGARIAALAGQLRAVGRMTAGLAGVQRIALPVAAANAADAIIVIPGELRSILDQVLAANSPSSPAFRHAVRLAVVIPLATEIARLLPWQRAYWLPLTCLIVLKPDYSATISRGIARTIGTGVGVIAAAGIVAALHPNGAALIVLIAACAWLGYTVFVANYAIYATFLTALVILLVASAQHSAISTVENRGFDTLIGGGIAILAYLVWPTWEAGALQVATAQRFETLGHYLGAVLAVYVDPDSYDPAALARLAATTRRAQSSVTASIQRARGEPDRTRPDIAHFAGVLAAGRRIVAGVQALASHLHDAKRQVAVPAAEDIVGQMDRAMAALVQALRSEHPPEPLPDLRHAHRRLTIATAAGQTPADRRGAILAALLDPLVDAIDTAADLLTAHHREPQPPPPPRLTARR
jgi:uncharacterized membrane protein YccC